MAADEENNAYDNLLVYIGGFGLFQKRVVFLVGLACAGQAFHMLNTIFTMAQQNFRCAIPGMPNDTFHTQSSAHAQMINSSIPFDQDIDGYSQCYRYGSDTNSSVRGSITSLDSSAQGLEACDSWVYDQGVFLSSVVSEFSLVCDRNIYTTHAKMLTLAGIMVGALIGGAFSDRFGRKKTFLVINWIQFLSALGLAFVQSVPGFLALRFIVSAAGLASFSTSCVLCMEMVSPRYRMLAGLMTMFGWCGGMLLLLLGAFLIREWRVLQLTLAVPLVIVAISYIWLLPESPRWLFSKGRHSEAELILTKMARVNKKELPEKMLLAEREYEIAATPVAAEQRTADTTTKNSNQSVMTILKSPVLFLRLLILAFGWMVNSMVYYGLTLNVGSIVEGSIFLNFFIMAVMEIVSYVMLIVLLTGPTGTGRRVVFCACVFLGGVACLATILPIVLDWSADWINTLLSNLGRFFITASFCILWIYSAEQFPTPLRQSGLGVCSFTGRIGGMVSPYIGALPDFIDGNIGKALPLLIFGVAPILAGIAAIFLPETANRKLPETVEDAEAMSWRSTRQVDKSSSQTTKC